MTGEQYNRIADRLRAHPAVISTIIIVNRFLTALGFAAYPGLILFICLRHIDEFSFRTAFKLFLLYIAGPALAFVLLSLYRTKKNAPRPYESGEIRPIIKKDTKGNSFPSRHIFSLSLIAALWYPFFRPAGILLLVSSLILALIRVVGGVHYIKDVAVGFLIGTGSGILINLLAGLWL